MTRELWPPRWTCPRCAHIFRQRPISLGGPPHVTCPVCGSCWGTEGHELHTLDYQPRHLADEDQGMGS